MVGVAELQELFVEGLAAAYPTHEVVDSHVLVVQVGEVAVGESSLGNSVMLKIHECKS